MLSARKALPIQAHPDKDLASKLHASDPAQYPDSNHKPEMAIALTNFEALCGFRPHSEIESFLDSIPELRALVGNKIALKFKNAQDKKRGLKQLFTALMKAPKKILVKSLRQLYKRWSREESIDAEREPLRKLFLRLHHSYPGDIGCFAIFFLNYLTLKPGEAIFLAANEPHAYISGGM